MMLAACNSTLTPVPDASNWVSPSQTETAPVGGDAEERLPASLTTASAEPPEGATLGRVTRILDGDTLDVVLPDGTVERVRLVGINAPESNECLADLAAVTLASLAPRGSTIAMTRDRTDRDQFGRLLRYLWIGPDSINARLVAQGVALARRYPPDIAHAEMLEAAQAEAQDAGAGLWAPDACGSTPPGVFEISDIHFDPIGDDMKALLDEYVVFINLSDEAVDLSGWAVRDESSSNRFAFPAGFTLAAGASVTLRSGCGVDSATDLHWCAQDAAIWNNSGDTVFLLSPSGQIMSSRSYRPGDEPPIDPDARDDIDYCHPSYPTVCLPSPPPDLNCSDIPHRGFSVVAPDPHGFDGNKDGVGCEA